MCICLMFHLLLVLKQLVLRVEGADIVLGTAGLDYKTEYCNIYSVHDCL